MPVVEEQTGVNASTKKNFVLAVVLHAALLGGMLGSAWIFHSRGEAWGDKQDLTGSVQATMVNSLPLPPRVQPKQDNVLASENPSPAPPPPTPKSEPPPQPTDIPIVRKDTKQPPKVSQRPAPEPPKVPPPTPVKPNLATSGETAGVRVAMSAVENRAGTSSTNVSDSAFGQRYAFYVRQLTQKVAQQWYTQTLDGGAVGHRVYVNFRVERDGSPSNITIAKPSGDSSLDASALRALQRIDTFGPLPDGYTGSFINVQYYFDPKAQ